MSAQMLAIVIKSLREMYIAHEISADEYAARMEDARLCPAWNAL